MKVILALVYIVSVVIVPYVNSSNVLVAKKFGHHICPDGYAVDQTYPDGLRYTCKPGPGAFVKCTSNLRYSKIPFTCSNFGYNSGWFPLTSELFVERCCTEKGLHYSLKDCRVNPNDANIRGDIHSIGKGKVTIGTQYIGGRWVGFECAYDKYTNKRYKNC